nr:probable glutathione peroxidase 8 [Vulpes vulpes]
MGTVCRCDCKKPEDGGAVPSNLEGGGVLVKVMVKVMVVVMVMVMVMVVVMVMLNLVTRRIYIRHKEDIKIFLGLLSRSIHTAYPLRRSGSKAKFGESEPFPSKEVVSFASNNYGATFLIFHKIKILGSEVDPAFRFLVDSSKKEPRWNFWRYLVNPEEQVVKSWRPEEPTEVIRPEIAGLVRQMILRKKDDL